MSWLKRIGFPLVVAVGGGLVGGCLLCRTAPPEPVKIPQAVSVTPSKCCEVKGCCKGGCLSLSP